MQYPFYFESIYSLVFYTSPPSMPFSCGFVRIETDLGKIIHYVQIQHILCFITNNKLENLARVCSETLLTGEPGSIVSVGASLGLELLPPLPSRRGANGLLIGPVRLCIGVKLQGLHRAPPQQFDQGI
jgi:hypothetical protein